MRKFDAFVREPVASRGKGRFAPRMFKPWPALLGTAAGGALLGWLLFVAFARLSGSDLSLWKPKIGGVPEAQLFDIVRSTATTAALVGGLFAIMYAYRKQRVEEAGGHRADAEALAKRYQDAAQQLGSDSAAVRLAGAYALARLADEWEDERQTCVDVLCAYLRMKPRQASDSSLGVEDLREDGDLQVRRTVSSILSSRLTGTSKGDNDGLWAECDIDLKGAELTDFKIADANLKGLVILNECSMRGRCELSRISFSRGLDAQRMKIIGSLKLRDVHSQDSRAISLTGMCVEKGGRLDLTFHCSPRKDSEWRLWLNNIECHGVVQVKLGNAVHEQEPLPVRGLTLHSGAAFRLSKLPVPKSEDSHLPGVEAREWSTSASSTVTVPKEMLARGAFAGTDWAGVHLTNFEHFYAPPLEFDKILGRAPDEISSEDRRI